MGTITRLIRKRRPLCNRHFAARDQCAQCGIAVARPPPALSTLQSKAIFFLGAIVLGGALSAVLDAMGIQQMSADRIAADCLIAIGYFFIFRWVQGYIQGAVLIPTDDRDKSPQKRNQR